MSYLDSRYLFFSPARSGLEMADPSGLTQPPVVVKDQVSVDGDGFLKTQIPVNEELSEGLELHELKKLI